MQRPSLLSTLSLRGVCAALIAAGVLPAGVTAHATPLLPGAGLISPAPLVVAADTNKDENPNNDPDYLYLQAITYQSPKYRTANGSNYKKAIDLYNQALKRRKGFYDALYNRAICNFYLKKYDDSIKDSTQHIEMRPSIMQAHVIRAKAYVQKKDYQPALTDLDLVEQKRPDLMDYRLRGKIYQGMENYAKAVPDFERYIAANKENAEAIPVYLDLGDAYGKTNQGDKAIQAFGSYIVNYDNMIKNLPELKGDPEQDNLPYALDKRGSAYLELARAANDPAAPELDRAEGDYKRYVEVKPNSALGYVGLGNVYILRNQRDQAIEVLNKAITLEPDNESAKFAIGRLERGEATVASAAGQSEAARGNLQTAITRFSEVLAKNPKNTGAYYERGLAYASPEVGNYEAAAADFSQFLANAAPNDPNTGVVYFNRGAAYANLGQFDKALPDFDAAIQADPKNTSAYIGRGDAYAKQGIYDKAVADYNVVINGGDDVDQKAKVAARFNRAVSYSKMQPPRTDEAIADLNTYLQVNGDSKPAKDLLFDLQLSQGPEKQLAALTTRVQDEPNNPDNYLLRASVFDKLKRYDEAIADYQKVIALKPSEIKAYQNLAADYSAKGYDDPANVDGAIAAYTKLISVAPTDAPYVQARGDLYLRKKQYAEAATDYKKALTLLPANDPKRLDVQYLVADVYRVSGNKAAAKTEFDAFLASAPASHPNYGDALTGRGDLLRDAKDYPGAIADYSKYLAAKPGDLRVLKVRGQSYLDSGDEAKALADFEAASAAAPNDAEAATLSGSIYYRQGSKAAQSDPDKAVPLYKKAIASTDKAIAADAKLAAAYYYNGLALGEDAEVDNLTPAEQKTMRQKAIASLNQFLTLAPDDPQAGAVKTILAKLQKAVAG